MRLIVKMSLSVAGDESERADMERLLAQMEADGSAKMRQSYKVDECLMNDFMGIVKQLGELKARARARTRRKK